MNRAELKIYAYSGDALTAPADTETAFLAALGGGAAGLVCPVCLTRDGIAVCTGNPAIRQMDWDAVQQLDAGAEFRSRTLGPDNRPTGNFGKDCPWADRPKGAALRYPTLERTLIVFGRCCPLIVAIASYDEQTVTTVAEQLKRYGLDGKVKVLGDYKTCGRISADCPGIRTILRLDSANDPTARIDEMRRSGISDIYMDWEMLDDNPQLTENAGFVFWFGSQEVYAPTAAVLEKILAVSRVGGIFVRGVLPAVSLLTPESLVLHDEFAGQRIDTVRWAAGYSHQNAETCITQDDGLHIAIREGKEYSGAAAVCLLPLYGRFDAQVDFHVGNPQQGTTFEMAAICIDPGYHHPDNTDLNSKKVNLTFDVHGAPPYASSERDEDDGFRCGWNNGFCLTQIGSDWTAASANMYNKYGRDVGCGAKENPAGSLRLVRTGPVFTTYYRDKYNDAWVCSGAMLVQNMAPFAYIRLAAKHWHKVAGRPNPANDIRFRNFKIYQF